MIARESISTTNAQTLLSNTTNEELVGIFSTIHEGVILSDVFLSFICTCVVEKLYYFLTPQIRGN